MSGHFHNIWQPTPDSLKLSSKNIDIWLCDLKRLLNYTDKFYSILSNDEKERAAKFKLEKNRQEYVITRGCLRQYLGLLTNTEPKNFMFKYLEYGKPVLENMPKFADVSFNVSHSHEFSLVAITQKHTVGIDIEKISRDSDHQSLVTRFFSKAEQSEFNTLPGKIRAKAFCACWTRKEAFIKAVGHGISYGLDNFDVAIDPELKTPRINLHNASEERWSALNLSINKDYMACLVSNSNDINVRYWV